MKSPLIFKFSGELNTVDRDLNQYKIVVPLNAQQLDTHFVVLISHLLISLHYLSVAFLKKNFNTWISIFPKLLVLENCKIALRNP